MSGDELGDKRFPTELSAEDSGFAEAVAVAVGNVDNDELDVDEAAGVGRDGPD